MAGKTISQFIRLEGAEEMRRMLDSIGQGGEKAFGQLQAAVEAANSKLESVASAVGSAEAAVIKFGAAGKQVKETFNEFASAAATVAARAAAVVGVVTGAATGIIALAKSAANASDDLVRNAQATGLAVSEYQALARAAREAGIEKEQFVAAFRKLAQDVVETAKREKDAVAGLAIEVAKLRDQPEPGVTRSRMIEDIQKQTEAIKKVAPEIQQALAAVGKNLSLDQVEADLRRLVQSGAPVAQFFKELGAPLPPGNVIDALKQKAEESATALGKLGVRTTEFVNGIQQVRPEIKIIEDAAEAFSKMAEGPAKVAVAAELLGRAGPLFSAFLNSGRKGILEATEALDKFGLRLNEVEIIAGQQMNRSFEKLGGTISQLKNKIAAVFQPTLTEAANAFRQIILENSLAIRQFAAGISTAAIPIVRDLIKILSGQDGAVQNQFLLTARDAIRDFGVAAKDAVLNIIVPAFNGLLAVLQKVADGINAVFGTTLTGGQIGVAIVVAQLVGAFGLLAGVIAAVVAGVKLLWAGFNALAATSAVVAAGLRAIGVTLLALVGWPALIVAGLVAAGVAIFVFWDDIKKGAQATFDFIKNGVSQLPGAIDNLVKGTKFEGAWAAFKAAALAAIKAVLGYFDDANAKVKEKIGELDKNATFGDKLVRDVQAKWELIKQIFIVKPAEIMVEFAKWITSLAERPEWGALVNKVGEVFNAMIASVQGFAGRALSFLQPIIDALDKVINRGKTAGELPTPAGSGFASPEQRGLFGQPGGGFADRLDRAGVPQSPNIEDRRGEGFGFDQIEADANEMLQRIGEIAGQVNERIAETFAALEQAASNAAQQITATFTASGELVGQLFASSIGRAVEATGELVSGVAGKADEAIGRITDKINESVRLMVAALEEAISQIAAQIDQVVARIIANLEAAVAKARELAQAAAAAAQAASEAASASGGGGGGGDGGSSDGFALGGFTGNIDPRRIAGVVHGKEHVQPAHVVARPGVLGFLEALRRSGGDLFGVISRLFGGYDAGGLVGSLGRSRLDSVSFAGAGLAPAAASLPHLGTLDLRTSQGATRVFVGTDAVSQIQTMNRRAQMVRIGKPARGQ